MVFDIRQLKPIENFSEDCLELKNYISGISTKIIQTFDSNENSCIGIVGKWGDGKTSAINLCLSKLIEHYNKQRERDYCGIFVLIMICFVILSFPLVYKEEIYNILLINIIPLLDNNRIYISICFFTVFCLLCGWKSYKIFISRLGKFWLKCIYKYVYKNQLVVIKFSPWNCTDEQQMIKEYLKLLSNELEVIESDISVKLLTYAKIINDNKFTNMLCAFATNQDISTLKQDITQKLKESNIKVVVVIDDFDRIRSSEIFNTLKVIGTIADFPNLVNIVAYDKQYICNNLKSYFESSGEAIDAQKYLQKIIPCEFPLPKISHEKLFNIFIEEVGNIVKEAPHNKKDLCYYYINTIGGYLCNIRDLKQFLNAFKFHYETFQRRGVHININDLLFITAIKTFNYTLWNNIYLLGKDYFWSSIGLGSVINSLSNDVEFSNHADNILGFKNLTLHESNILGSLIPRLRKDVSHHMHFIEDSYCFDIKRFWSGRETFNLYFEFNPPESNCEEILKTLQNEKFQKSKFEKLLNNDVAWSDLNDIMYANQYSKDVNNIVVLNYIKILINNFKDIQFERKFVRMKACDVELFNKISLNEFIELIDSFLNKNDTNINAIIELIYSYFLYKKDSKDLWDVATVEGDAFKALSVILNQFKGVLKNKSIRNLTVRSLYYLCTAIGIIDEEVREIIQQKILESINQLDNGELLEFLNNFKFETRDNVYSLDILKDKDVFNDDIIKTLKSKLLILQDNEVIMQNSQYICIFTSYDDLPSKEDKPQHIVDYILKDLYNV